MKLLKVVKNIINRQVSLQIVLLIIFLIMYSYFFVSMSQLFHMFNRDSPLFHHVYLCSFAILAYLKVLLSNFLMIS